MKPTPGIPESPRAQRVLVLAPHPDDEIVGCGGLLLQLLASGSLVEVVFLTDGSGGDETVENREGYAARRREEATAVAAQLGFAAVFLDARDGELAAHLEAIAARVRARILAHAPALILVPSPLEASSDHRAAFATLREALAGDDIGAGVEILCYEVNQPGRPDLLVDVSAEVAGIEAAMALYSSQEARHPYLAAALGLRRFRGLSLPPGVSAAEAYVRLTPNDLRTRSPARLVLDLGGSPALAVVDEFPTVSVVVRTLDRPGLLRQALASLAQQTWRRTEVVLVNDGGTPPEVPGDFPLPLVRLDLPATRGRADAANAGIAAAGGELIAFLDDDDLADPEHIETLARTAAAPGVDIAYVDAAVGTYILDPGSVHGNGWSLLERRVPYSRDFDADLLLVDNYIPFNTIVIPRRLLDRVGPLDPELPFFEDWELLIRLAARTRFHHLARVTCEYRHFRGGSHIFGESPRARADFLTVKARVIARHSDRLGPLEIASIVDHLRAEAVMAEEEARRWREDGAKAVDQAARLDSAFAGLRSEHERLELSWQRLQQEIARLHTTEQQLHEALGGRDQQLGEREGEIQRLLASEAALYGEVARLQGLIEAMESTQAWRWHRKLEGLRGR